MARPGWKDPHLEAAYAETRDLKRKARAEKEARILRLASDGELTQTEIAQSVGVSNDFVRKTVLRASHA